MTKSQAYDEMVDADLKVADAQVPELKQFYANVLNRNRD
jgi:hypothetical protein